MKPCGKCGGTDRNASGNCRPCQAERGKRWAEANADKERARKAAAYRADREAWIARSIARVKANPEERLAYIQKWRDANKAKVNGYSTRWRADNRAKRKLVVKEWEQRNPERVRVNRQNRRSRVAAAPGRLSPGLVPRLLKLQRGKCACCKKALGSRFELDHIIPLALNGSNRDDNMQLLRAECNRRKSARHPIDYMQSKGLLL